MNISSKYTLLAAGLVLALSSCDENAWNDKLDGFEEPPTYSKVETINYTLTADDYKTIATNSANKALAEKEGEAAVAALAAVQTDCSFASEEDARLYIPALLSSSSFPYFALNNESSIKVTYNLSTNQPEEILAINTPGNVLTYKLKDADYQEAWGSEEDFIPSFAPMTPADANLPAILKAALPTAVAGNYAMVTYNNSEINPVFATVGSGEVSDEPADGIYLDATFADGDADFTMENPLLPTELSYIWTLDANYSCMKASAYKGGNFEAEGWLISPEIKLGASTNAVLTFEQVWNYFASLDVAAEEATVHIREVGGAWTKLTVPSLPEKLGFSPWAASGDISLAAWNGKTVQIGFCYKSTAAKAGTWEVKNIRVVVGPKPEAAPLRAAAAPVPSVQQFGFYYFDGTDWTVPANTVVVQPSDFTAMGLTYSNFSGTQPQENIPVFLAGKYPYATDGIEKTVVYNYYASGVTAAHASQYVKAQGEWALNTGATVDQFTKTDNTWKYNPSVIINLPYARNTDPSYTYFMACKDWVFENVTLKLYPGSKPADGSKPGPPFIDYRNNAEFYSGSSAYYGNVDVRAITAISNAPEGYTGYDGLSDDEITLLIKKRFSTETLPGALKALHSDAQPVKDMEVTYTVNFTAYGEAATEESIVYVVSGPGEFTYKSSTWVEKGQDKEW